MVERQPSKLNVDGSSPFTRFVKEAALMGCFFCAPISFAELLRRLGVFIDFRAVI
tara:strand:+ start:92239 stop:92403 length:165 start_codon:yes stop_codon:yes gene_type:complete